MLTIEEKDILIQATSKTKILLNDDIQWSFFSDYNLTFSEMQKDDNCPIMTMKANGTVNQNGKNHYAYLFVSYHKDLRKWSSVVCFLDDNREVIKSIDITSIKKVK